MTFKVVSESRVTWATSVPILVFLGLSVLELGPMNATDVIQTETSDRRQTKPSLNASALWGRRHNKKVFPSLSSIVVTFLFIGFISFYL